MKRRPCFFADNRPAQGPGGFTLVELLVVISIIAMLVAMLLPALVRGQEKAKVTRAHTELHCIGLALEMYSGDNQRRLPPVRVNCNTDLSTHWCELPVELAQQHYLGGSTNAGMAANMLDVFNSNHTYKYAAPGPQLLNGRSTQNYELWVPDDFPNCASTNGQYHSDPKASPVRWVIWSLGPQPDGPRSQNAYAPMGNWSWYSSTGGGGVVACFAGQDGTQYTTP